MKVTQFGINQQIVVIRGEGDETGANLFDAQDKACDKLIVEIAKDDNASKFLLFENKRTINGTFVWSEYHENINSLIFQIDEKLFKFPKYRNLLVKYIEEQC